MKAKNIKATELRIGNWVYDDDNVTMVQIEGIESDSLYEFEGGVEDTQFSFYRNGVMWEGDKVYPIILTPEILEKIGKRSFVRGETKTYWKIGDWLLGEDEHMLNKGLHWFQNWHYFHTGEELNITP